MNTTSTAEASPQSVRRSRPNAATAEPLCELQHVRREFAMPNGSPRTVLESIDVAIRPNEVVALLGPSGCGKSTILRILAGLIRPTAGEVLYHNKPMVGLNPGVAMVFQSFALYPWMTVTENIEIVLKAAGLENKEVAESRHIEHSNGGSFGL